MTPQSPLRQSLVSYGSLDSDSGFGEPTRPPPRPLNVVNKTAFVVGHVFNDMCAGVWFTYLLVMLQNVRGLTASQAGTVMFIGQSSDAAFTPLNGILSDRSKGLPCCGMGRRKLFHFLGTLVVTFAFYLVFGMRLPAALADDPSKHKLMAYYAGSAVLFNAGWSAVQVAHMSILPEIVEDASERLWMNSARYAMTVVSNIFVFVVLWVIIHLAKQSGTQEFTSLTIVVLSCGAAASLFFQVGTREDPPVPKPRADRVTWRDWLSFNPFWSVGLTYTFTRLVVNISQIYIPFFTTSIGLSEEYITVMPLIVYVSSMGASMVMQKVNRQFGRKKTFILGCLFCGGALVGFWFLERRTRFWMFPACVVLGLGNATIMVCATQLLADLVYTYTESAAFVYGGISLTDKIANGLAIFVVQQFNTGTPRSIKMAIVIAPAATLVAALLLLSFVPDITDMQTMERKFKRRQAAAVSSDRLNAAALLGTRIAKRLRRRNTGSTVRQHSTANEPAHRGDSVSSVGNVPWPVAGTSTGLESVVQGDQHTTRGRSSGDATTSPKRYSATLERWQERERAAELLTQVAGVAALSGLLEAGRTGQGAVMHKQMCDHQRVAQAAEQLHQLAASLSPSLHKESKRIGVMAVYLEEAFSTGVLYNTSTIPAGRPLSPSYAHSEQAYALADHELPEQRDSDN